MYNPRVRANKSLKMLRDKKLIYKAHLQAVFFLSDGSPIENVRLWIMLLTRPSYALILMYIADTGTKK